MIKLLRTGLSIEINLAPEDAPLFVTETTNALEEGIEALILDEKANIAHTLIQLLKRFRLQPGQLQLGTQLSPS